jgi:hypothetical protein
MQNTATTTDLLFGTGRDLVIAVIGAIIATYLIGAGPRWLANALTWRATRSKKSADKRANHLRDELQKIGELRNDLSQYVGFLIGDFAKGLFLLVFSIILFLIYDGARDCPVCSRLETSLYFLLFGISLTVASWYFGRLGQYSDLTKREARVVKQIDKLQSVGECESKKAPPGIPERGK